MTASLDRAVEAALAALRTEELNVLGGYLTPLNGARRQTMRAALLAALPHLGVDREALRTAVEALQEFKPRGQKHPHSAKGFVVGMSKSKPPEQGEEYGWVNKGTILALIETNQEATP
jgi:hypothetical protein